MENLTSALAGHQPAHRPRFKAGIVAVTGSPGSGVGTAARVLSTEYGALMMSMASKPRIAHEMTFGLHPERRIAPAAFLDFRLAEERKNGLCWIRPFHRRLKRILRFDPRRRIVITGILTPRELAYCKGIGARLIHLTAPEAVRRIRIGTRFPEEPHQGLLALDLLMRSRPHSWDVIVDSDEPYPEFIQSLKAQLGRF